MRTPITGRWRILEMERWDLDAIDALRAVAGATGLSRQTIANICAAGNRPARGRARAR